MPTFTPTEEQERALALYATGHHMAIEAGAGCGKTATLDLLARSRPDRLAQYVAFNRAIVDEAGRKMPDNVVCQTMHSVAYRAVGFRYAHRIGGARMKSGEIARRLRIDPLVIYFGSEAKRLAAGFLAGHVMRALGSFCQSADPEPSEQHFAYIDGIDEPAPDGKRTWANNRSVRAHLIGALRRAWADVQDLQGQLRFDHAHYLKIFERSEPAMAAEVVLFDECQDASPVMLSIVQQQSERAQLVFVGDSAQQIYSWMGSVNALGRIRETGAEETTLSKSFRFGPAIADVANGLLARAGHSLRLEGSASWASVVAPTPDPRCILTRTNAVAVETLLRELAAGRRVAIMGGGSEVFSFAKAAADLKAGGDTTHPELACFSSWNSVKDYVANDPQGGELRLMVSLIDEFGPAAIMAGLSRASSEADADLVVSTAHKAKGCEWESVQIAGDFEPAGVGKKKSDPEADSGEEELRLMYVAATRAQRELDLTRAPRFLSAPPKGTPSAPSRPSTEPETKGQYDLAAELFARAFSGPEEDEEEDYGGLDAKSLTQRYMDRGSR